MSNEIVPLTIEETALAVPQRLGDNPAAVYIARLTSPHSRRTMISALNHISHLMTTGQPKPAATKGKGRRSDDDAYLRFSWENLRYQHAAALKARLIEIYQPATANKLLAALKGVLQESWRLGYMGAEEYHRAIDFKGVKAATLPAGRDLSAGEIMALEGVCADDQTAAGARDSALLAVLANAGLRRAEVAALDRANFDAESGKLIVRSGKGRKDRTVYLTNGGLQAVLDWLDIRGDEPGALFLTVNKSGKIYRQYLPPAKEGEPPKLRGITAQAIFNMLKKRGEQAGVENFSPHDFRRAFAGDLMDEGVDISTVSKLMGHSNVETTGRYDRRPEEVKKAAAAKLHYPHRKRKKLV